MWRWMLGFLAALLGALWAYTAWHTDKIEKNLPPTGKFVTVDGVDLHYEEAGSGPSVVLLHGAGANLHDWKASLFDEAARDHRVIAFDRPGHGYSGRAAENGHDPRVQAALIHGALRELGVEKPVLVGHSWSGALVLAYALAFPEDARAIVVLAGVSHPSEGSVRSTYRIAAAPYIGPFFRHTLMAPLGELLLPPNVKAAFAPNPPTPDFTDKAALRLLLRPRAFLNNAEDTIHLSDALGEMSPDYGKLSVRAVIISGVADRWVDPEKHARKLHEAAPDSRLILIPDIGHMPHHIRPILVTDEIARIT
ncbi:MAG: alpha/beta fold hydrolase, partial [bacterium]